MRGDLSVLGLNAAYHETAAVHLASGSLVATEEERFTGIKHGKDANPYGSWRLPFHAIDYCLRENGATLHDVAHVAYSFVPSKRLWGRIVPAGLRLGVGRSEPLVREIAYYYFNRRAPHFLTSAMPRRQEVRKRFLVSGRPWWKFHFVEHHLAHAASAFFVSPFEEAAIASIDGIGEIACTLLAKGRGNRISKVREFAYPHSLGFFYEEITKFLGFLANHDEGKVMALAAYGRPKYYEELAQLVELERHGDYRVRIDFEDSSIFGVKELHEVLGPPRLWGSRIEPKHADIAASAQKVLEDTVLHVLRWLHETTSCGNLCLAGGVALNCVLNERIRQESPFKSVFVQPAAHDAGTALGAALWVWHQVLNQPRRFLLNHAYLGPHYTDAEIQRKLESVGIPYERCPDIAATCAELLAEGKVLGWFQGRMEWGPRALGNRSILADPRDCGMRDRVNEIKGREEFRPLAPSILEDEVGKFFEDSAPSPFMLFARRVRPEMLRLIPAAVHVDGTARLQTVNSQDNPLFHNLIAEFRRRTGIPALLNTSLNYGGKPIACNVQQALDCFINSGIDYLAIGSYLIAKEASSHERSSAAQRSAAVGVS